MKQTALAKRLAILQAAAGTSLAPVESPSARGAVQLSLSAEKVLESAWQESLLHGGPSAIDTADLVIGLLQVASTARTLHSLGVTTDRVRSAKRTSRGYELSGRFSSLHFKRPIKTQQVGRVAQLVAAAVQITGRDVIQPEDILEVIAVDGLGWGIGILEELGVTSSLLQERARDPLAGMLPDPVAE